MEQTLTSAEAPLCGGAIFIPVAQGCEADGTGPFVISCMHGRGDIMEQYEKTRGELDGERYVISRS